MKCKLNVNSLEYNQPIKNNLTNIVAVTSEINGSAVWITDINYEILEFVDMCYGDNSTSDAIDVAIKIKEEGYKQ